MTFHVPEQYRVKQSRLGSDYPYGNNGHFVVSTSREVIFIIASDGVGWEHVSISLKNRIPKWGEMCEMKDLFWDAEDCVIQFHPPKSAYVNNPAYSLHLWRPSDGAIPMPPAWMVGAGKP